MATGYRRTVAGSANSNADHVFSFFHDGTLVTTTSGADITDAAGTMDQVRIYFATAPAANVIFTLYKNGVSQGTVTYVQLTGGVQTFSVSWTYAAGDYIQIAAGTADGGDVTVKLYGTPS